MNFFPCACECQLKIIIFFANEKNQAKPVLTSGELRCSLLYYYYISDVSTWCHIFVGDETPINYSAFWVWADGGGGGSSSMRVCVCVCVSNTLMECQLYHKNEFNIVYAISHLNAYQFLNNRNQKHSNSTTVQSAALWQVYSSKSPLYEWPCKCNQRPTK